MLNIGKIDSAPALTNRALASPGRFPDPHGHMPNAEKSRHGTLNLIASGAGPRKPHPSNESFPDFGRIKPALEGVLIPNQWPRTR
jgi:hypothetical protein